MDIDALETARIAVLCGGPGVERAISLESGTCVTEGLRAAGLRAERQIVSGDPEEIARLDADLVFLALHGEFGEDGTVQGLLESRGLPYTGSNPAASALAMDKQATKAMFATVHIPTPAGTLIRDVDEAARCVMDAGLAYPLVVKPNSRGSSVGVQIVRSAETLAAAVAGALAIDEAALAERFIAGREMTVGILGGDMLPVVELRTGNEFYDFEAKYVSEATEYICPAPLDADEVERLHTVARAAVDVVGVRDMGRVDILFAGGVPYVLEINTIPGMTSHSLLPKAAAAAGCSFADLCRRIATLAWSRSTGA